MEGLNKITTLVQIDFRPKEHVRTVCVFCKGFLHLSWRFDLEKALRRIKGRVLCIERTCALLMGFSFLCVFPINKNTTGFFVSPLPSSKWLIA